MLGADTFNGAPSGLGNFKQSTGATYPLLVDAALSSGGNILTLYGVRDHLVVISRQGIVRYQSNDHWDYGDPYLLDDVRASVDSLVAAAPIVHPGRLLAREPARRPRQEPFASESEVAFSAGASLRVGVGPNRSTIEVALANPFGRAVAARVTVHDLAGRRVATLLDGSAAPGRTTLTWDGRGPGGAAMASGIYHVLADVGATRLSRRIALVR